MFDLTGITGITADSRTVKPGYLFAAIKGASSDGNDYIPQAVKAGAIAILSAHHHDLPEGVRLIRDDNPRRALAKCAAQFYGAQPDTIVAVTGTNGKSSVVTFAQQLWQVRGLKATSLGTINAKLTSPDPVALHEMLAQLAKEGMTHVALEASSHGLDQCRLDGVYIRAAGFTNLSRDHLDYHADMEDYLGAKARLFSECVDPGGISVINGDAPEEAALIHASRAPCLTYGYDARHLQIIEAAPAGAGMDVKLALFDKEYRLSIPLIGRFQLYNLLCAAGLVLGTMEPARSDIDALVEAFKAIKPVKGRLQHVAGHPAGADIYIDYAHTPDALETVLTAVRPHVKGRLYCMFGCGGDRDKGKRPLMGQVAANRSDAVIITDDNPRNEKAVDIRNQVLAPIREAMHNETVFEIGDRAAAIDFSVKQLQKGDVLVIAGKGHESGQILADKVIPFDDYEQALKAIEKLRNE